MIDRRGWLCGAAAWAAGCGLAASAGEPSSRAAGLSAREIFAQASPAVVRVVVLHETGAGLGSGSGFLVSSDGLVVTNYHVIELAGTTDHLAVVLDGQRRKVMGLVGAMPKEDLALLAVERKAGEKLPFLPLADRLPAQGERAYAIGYPLGLKNATISDGLVSGLQGILGMELLQISVPISKGSSGGPVLTDDGRVVGASAGSLEDGQNLNFAVPVEHVRRLVKDAGAPRKEIPAFARPVRITGIPKTERPVDFSKAVDLRDLSAPMTLERLYAGMIRKYILIGGIRPDLDEAARKQLFDRYVQDLCTQQLPGRRITCEVVVLSLTPGSNRARQVQFLRQQVPLNNPPEQAAECLRLLRDASPYSVRAVCKSPWWPEQFDAYLHAAHAKNLAARKPGEPVTICGFLSQWVAVPPGLTLRLSITLDACVLAGKEVAVEDDAAAAKLKLAKVYADAGLKDKAIQTLESIVSKYGDSESGREAAAMLERLRKSSP